MVKRWVCECGVSVSRTDGIENRECGFCEPIHREQTRRMNRFLRWYLVGGKQHPGLLIEAREARRWAKLGSEPRR